MTAPLISAQGVQAWDKRRAAQKAQIAEDELREEQLHGERDKHIREHIECVNAQRVDMDGIRCFSCHKFITKTRARITAFSSLQQAAIDIQAKISHLFAGYLIRFDQALVGAGLVKARDGLGLVKNWARLHVGSDQVSCWFRSDQDSCWPRFNQS